MSSKRCPLTKIQAPYNFVPLSDFVFQPKWHQQVSHSRPLKQGVSGALTLKISAHTPLLAGEYKKKSKNNDEKDGVYPYRLPNGEYAIPGSSLRGMIRNVLEIASFGKMRNIDDKRYSVRDVSATFYTEPLDRVETGWLHYADNEWFIRPCKYKSINHKIIRGYLTDKHNHQWMSTPKEKGKFEADDKYRSWLRVENDLMIYFSATNTKVQKIYSTAMFTTGHLVYTGQPSSKKEVDFVFYNQQKTKTIIEPRVIQDFLSIYQESEHWQYLNDNHRKAFPDQGIPVFFLQEDDEFGNKRIASLGLSKMYKLAYRHSIGDMVDHTSTDHRRNNHHDLAELIFGTVDDDDGTHSLKGRVDFSPASCDTTDEEVFTESHNTILNSPKPTFYPNYVRQGRYDPLTKKLQATEYKTYMDKAELRGWKRYPVRETINIHQLDAKQQQNTKIQVNLNPLQASEDDPLHFTGKMRFHNLLPEELGALIWVLTWGGNPQLRHAIGMGKPFGFGQLSIAIDNAKLTSNQRSATKKTVTLEQCQQAFVEMMSEHYPISKAFPSWQYSKQLLYLMAMADPDNVGNKKLASMELTCFANLKNSSNRQVLTEYIDNEQDEKSKRLKQFSEIFKQGDAADNEILMNEIEEKIRIDRQKKDEDRKQAAIKQKEHLKNTYSTLFNDPQAIMLCVKLDEGLASREKKGAVKQIKAAVTGLLKAIEFYSESEKDSAIKLIQQAIDAPKIYSERDRKKFVKKLNSI